MSDTTTRLIASLAEGSAAVAPVKLRVVYGRWLAGFAAYMAALVALTGVSPELATALDRPFFVMEITLLLALSASTVFSACLLSFPDRHQYSIGLWLPVPLLLAFMAVMALSWMHNPSDLPAHHPGLECLACISLYALIPGAWLLWRMRQLASTHPALAGAAAITASFCMGALPLRLLEANESTIHVMQGHYLPLLAAAFIGCGLGKWLLKW